MSDSRPGSESHPENDNDVPKAQDPDERKSVRLPRDAPTIDPDTIARALRDAATIDPDTIARALRDAATIDPDTIARALRDAATIDPDTITRALRDAATIDLQAVARALGRHHRESAPAKLVSETALEDGAEEDRETRLTVEAARGVPHELDTLMSALQEQGFSPELRERPRADGGYEVAFDLIAGRSTRTVAVDVNGAHVLLGNDVSAWRSLQRYDGIWSQLEGIIEIAVRGERFGLPASHLMRRLAGVSTAESDADLYAPSVEFTDGSSGVLLRIGESSDIASVLLSVPGRPRRRLPITLCISNIAVSTTTDADNLVERIADAFSFNLDVAWGIALMPQRLENRDRVPGRYTRRTGSVTFPRNSYPHAPILLYQAGRDRSAAPLIRYWSFYQVLEYFFPKHTQAEALRKISRHLRSPAFDPHRDEDVLSVVQLAISTEGGPGSEQLQLLTTLQAITSPEEIIEFAASNRLADQLEDRASELTKRDVKLNAGSDLLPQLASRIYDIRCRIVHSKSAGQRDPGPGLLPGTHHDDLVRNELPLMEYLAQQSLISAAEPLTLPQRGIPG